jgi:hypothetical protein
MRQRVPSPVVMVTERALAPGRLLKFDQPQRLLVALRPEQVEDCLQQADEALAKGHHVAGYLSYEAALGLDHAFETSRDYEMPLLWLAYFRRQPVPTDPSHMLCPAACDGRPSYSRGIPSCDRLHSVPNCRRLNLSGQLHVSPLVVLCWRSVGAVLSPLPQPALHVLHVHRHRAVVERARKEKEARLKTAAAEIRGRR